jgi:hypothetical protein
MPVFVNASNVRSFAAIDSINHPWSESNLGSNIRAASAFLQRATGRQFEAQTGVTKKFTTNGQAYISIPDLRTATSITLSGTSMTLDTDAWLLPDSQQSGVYVGMQFRPYGGRGGYRSFPDWFDTNKDRWYGLYGSDVHDLSITGDWGHDPLPDELLHATKALALWYTKRPDASLSNTLQTPDGNIFDLSSLPAEVTTFIANWKVGSFVEAM